MDQGRYQLQCELTGVIKAYKRMTGQKAQERNLRLSGEGSECRWAPALLGYR
ncbi:MAG: hypothetical protein AVDCRST_MAG93-9519 [uncultured Chloroflexia bacterium]|uniref:Uncharacterized protein n=1 Tax=uncultured Chloroflexia bacterium TaxID=1672391 RepID=A0A6J4NFQ9_9CHLR|nr:MAG: hypothetical protein AVDCRST_MAG93-9519 [uncultured Chloroflexia bacterium]